LTGAAGAVVAASGWVGKDWGAAALNGMAAVAGFSPSAGAVAGAGSAGTATGVGSEALDLGHKEQPARKVAATMAIMPSVALRVRGVLCKSVERQCMGRVLSG